MKSEHCAALITAAEWADRKATRRHGQGPPQVICTHNLKPRWPQDECQLQVRVIIDGERNHRISMYLSVKLIAGDEMVQSL